MEAIAYCYKEKDTESVMFWWQLFLVTDNEEDKIIRITTIGLSTIYRTCAPYKKYILSDNYIRDIFDQYTIGHIDLVDDIEFDLPNDDIILNGNYYFPKRMIKEILDETLYCIDLLNYTDEYIQQVKSLILKTNIYHEQDSFKKT